MTSIATPDSPHFRHVHNVFYELPDLIIQPITSGVPGNPPWEFRFIERLEGAVIAHLSLMDLKKKFFTEQDTLFLEVEYHDGKDREDNPIIYRPHTFAVQHIYPFEQCDEPTKELVYTALVYKVVAEMDLRLRQHCFRQADPGIRKATLRGYNGKVWASSLASQFLPYVIAPKKS